MEKIAKNFREQILKQPNKQHNIVIVCKSNIAPEGYNLKAIPGIDNCFIGSLTGRKILTLEKSDKVISVEIDGEIQAF